MKELAVIGRRLSEPRTGFGRYLECLLRHWGRMETQFDRIRAYVWEDPGLPAQGKVEFEVVGLIGSPLIWENWTLANRLRQSSLIFGAYTLPWFLADRGVVSNLGIYESRPDDFPLLARMRTTLFYKRAARKAVRVIANSSSTRDDLVGYYGADPAKVEVVLLGADERLSPGPSELPGDLRARYGLPDGPFFLLVGKLSQRRNIPMLIEALAAVEGYSLVIVGPDYLGLDIEALARRSGVADRVYHVEHLPMEELVHCYRAATAFVLPTLHEGFSLTIVEAMACGTPAIVFDHASLEGLVRDAVLFAEAGVESLAAAMNLVASDRELERRQPRRSQPALARSRAGLSLGDDRGAHDADFGEGGGLRQDPGTRSAVAACMRRLPVVKLKLRP